MRNNKIRGLILASVIAVCSSTTLAQTTTIVVPFSAGGPTDFMARQLAQPLSKELGMPVVIENKPGASGNIGTKSVVDAKPDGLTLVHSTAAMQAVNPLMYPDANFNPSKDLIPVGITGSLPNVLVVHPDSGIRSVKELVEKGKAANAQLSYATFGAGSSPHFYGAILQKSTGIAAMPIPYKGSAHAITDMLAGRIDFMFDSMTTSITHLKSGKLVGLAITSNERSPLLPDLPTLKEAGYGDIDVSFWFALQEPVGTPADQVQKLRVAIDRAVQNSDYRQSVAARGVQNFYVPPQEIESFVRTDTQKWREAAQSIGIKAE